MANTNNQASVTSFFCGCGGLDLGFRGDFTYHGEYYPALPFSIDKAYTLRNLPLFWILKDGESRATCDKKIKSRYWAEEFTSGNYRFLVFSQWYDGSKHGAHKENFVEWYNSL